MDMKKDLLPPCRKLHGFLGTLEIILLVVVVFYIFWRQFWRCFSLALLFRSMIPLCSVCHVSSDHFSCCPVEPFQVFQMAVQWGPHTRHCSSCDLSALTRAKKIISCVLQASLLFVHCCMTLAFFATAWCCWLIFTLWSRITPSYSYLAICSLPCIYLIKCSSFPLTLLNFTLFYQTISPA